LIQRFSLAARIVTRLNIDSVFLDSVIALSSQRAVLTPLPAYVSIKTITDEIKPGQNWGLEQKVRY
jgi:hypothetical protein